METEAVAAIAERCSDLLSRLDGVWTGLPLAADGGGSVETLRQLLGGPPDLVVRPVGTQVWVLYLKTIVDPGRIEQALIRPLSLAAQSGAPLAAGFGGDVSALHTYGDALQALLAAQALVLGADQAGALAVSVANWPKRPPSEPPSEVVSQGPHIGFIESLDVNLALLRHLIPDRRLRWEQFQVGDRNQGEGALVYVEGLVRPGLLDEVHRQLARIRPSFASDASMLAQWLSPRAYLFPTIGVSERPDTTMAALLEGRVALFVDGSPVALLVPQVFAHLLHVPEDYYMRSFGATIERTFRLFGLILALTVTPLYVALVTVNLELVPTPLYLTITEARLSVPLSTLSEVLLLELIVEVIRQAGLRLPNSLGQPVAIIGAVVIGQSAVIAGLVSSPAVVVVALGFIISFVVPSLATVTALRTLRFPLIFLAAVFGVLGIAGGMMLLFIYLSAIESFGVPYLAPIAPLRPRGLQDVLWRRPLTGMRRSFAARPRRAPTVRRRGDAA